MNDYWEGLSIPAFLRVENRRVSKQPLARNHVEAKAPEAPKRPFHLPKTIEPEGLRLLGEIEGEKDRKKAERLEALKALPKKPRKRRVTKPAMKRAQHAPAKPKRKKRHVARHH